MPNLVPRFVIDRRDCQRVRILLACLMLLALAGVGRADWPPPGQLAAALLVMGVGWRELQRSSPRSPRFVAWIAMAPEGRFLVGLGADPETPVPMAVTQSWLLPGLAAGLTFSAPERPHCVAILFRDRVPPDSWRQLAVRLRHPSAAVKAARLT